MFAPPNRGSFISTHVYGTHVPVKEPSTASFSGSPPLIGVIDLHNQSQSGDGLMKRNVFALFGAVAVLLTATAALTLSRVTPLASGIDGLKCYDIKGGIEKCSIVDRPPRIVRTSVRHTRLD
jgi:hypothetical protein